MQHERLGLGSELLYFSVPIHLLIQQQFESALEAVTNLFLDRVWLQPLHVLCGQSELLSFLL